MKLTMPLNKVIYKIAIYIIASGLIIGIGQYLWYWKTLDNQTENYIEDFYKSGFSGRITYIEKYEFENYVIVITDRKGIEKTIGKVKIENFENAIEGDSINKKSNSFNLEIFNLKGIQNSVVQFQ